MTRGWSRRFSADVHEENAAQKTRLPHGPAMEPCVPLRHFAENALFSKKSFQHLPRTTNFAPQPPRPDVSSTLPPAGRGKHTGRQVYPPVAGCQWHITDHITERGKNRQLSCGHACIFALALDTPRPPMYRICGLTNGPLRLAVQDNRFSAYGQGFESPRGYQLLRGGCRFAAAFSLVTDTEASSVG